MRIYFLVAAASFAFVAAGPILVEHTAPIAVEAASSTPTNAVLVLEKAQNTLVIVNPSNLAIVARVPAGNDPHEVAVSDDGNVAYISNYSGGHTISRVDLVAQKAVFHRRRREGRRAL